MGQLEWFYMVLKNSCTKVYPKVFLAVRYFSICLPKTNSYRLPSPLKLILVGLGIQPKSNFGFLRG